MPVRVVVQAMFIKPQDTTQKLPLRRILLGTTNMTESIELAEQLQRIQFTETRLNDPTSLERDLRKYAQTYIPGVDPLVRLSSGIGVSTQSRICALVVQHSSASREPLGEEARILQSCLSRIGSRPVSFEYIATELKQYIALLDNAFFFGILRERNKDNKHAVKLIVHQQAKGDPRAAFDPRTGTINMYIPNKTSHLGTWIGSLAHELVHAWLSVLPQDFTAPYKDEHTLMWYSLFSWVIEKLIG
ncbi:hypothetical protein F5Y15DRAFT_97402 [Xylariaceae sp. FL0016]|nr:hypothetical protein F5Y15DRAFT_97402 [Xylariaceae sp. FL0016]